MEIVYVYALAEPDTNEVRYIGLTSEPGRRLQEHMSALRSHSVKVEWLKSLKVAGRMPQLVILETVECEHWSDAEPREQAWIHHYCAQGADLTNAQHNFSRRFWLDVEQPASER
jgi:predicted GIY-YIG superfamily endonuclease